MKKDTPPTTAAQVRDFFVAAGERLKPFIGQDSAQLTCTFISFGNGSVKSAPLFSVKVGNNPVVANPDFDVAIKTALASFKPDELKTKAATLRAQADALEAQAAHTETATAEAAVS